jgi:hypothetical protein
LQALLQCKSNTHCVFCVCVCVCVALISQHAMHMRHIVVCGLTCSTIFFHIISEKVQVSKNVTEDKMCVLIFSTSLNESFRILGITERDMIKNVIAFHVSNPLFLSDFNET